MIWLLLQAGSSLPGLKLDTLKLPSASYMGLGFRVKALGLREQGTNSKESL